MINLKSLIIEAQVKKISLDYAISNKFFGPIYHGTSAEKREIIDREGFKIFYNDSRSTETSNGYEIYDYYGGIPAPVHHLGFGVYMTTVKNIAKKYNHGTISGLKIYYADAPRLEIINFAKNSTMMNWWIKNGYDYDTKSPEKLFGNSKTNLAAIKSERYSATVKMTNYLKSKYDAIWFKGKTMFRTLDGDQICIYNPDNIYEIDIKLSAPWTVGSKVVLKIGFDNIPIGSKGTILRKHNINPLQKWAAGSDFIYTVKFKNGGTKYGILKQYIDPVI